MPIALARVGKRSRRGQPIAELDQLDDPPVQDRQEDGFRGAIEQPVEGGQRVGEPCARRPRR